MKTLPLTATALLGIASMLAFPSQEAMAQGKGRAGARIGGAGVKSGPVIGGAGFSVGNRGSSFGGTTTSHTASHGNNNSGGTAIIISPGIGSSLYGGYGPNYGLGIGGLGYGGLGYNDYPLAGAATGGVYPNNYATSVYPNAYSASPYPSSSVSANPNSNLANAQYGTIHQYANLSPNVETVPLPRTTAATATVEVSLPSPDAELWFNGVKMHSMGEKREFVTPELAPGQSYTYEIRAKWSLNGKDYDQSRSFTVQSGSQIVVNITVDTREQLPLPIGIKI